MKTMRRTKIILFLLCVILCMAAFGCGGKDPLREGKTEISFWGFADYDEAESIRASVDWYNQNTGDKVDKIYIDYQVKQDYQ